MKRTVVSLSLVGASLLTFTLVATLHARSAPEHRSDSRIQQGFRISPVPMNLKGRNPALVGLGSYLVNAVGSCNDCHTCPSYTPGHDPYGPPFGPPGGGDGQINATNFLAGGVPFNPPGVTSPNLTPSLANGLPDGGHTFAQFVTMMRTGHDVDDPSHILQVMPWPVIRNMTDRDLRAVYEYLQSIPHAEPGACVAPGQ